MKKNKKFFLVVLALCVIYGVLAVGVPLVTKSYETAEEGIARYVGIEQENVLLLTSLQDGQYLYTIWENTATKEVGMTVLQKQQWLGRLLLHPCMALGTGKTPYFGCFCTTNGTYPNVESLIVVACDNRENVFDYCELEMARYDGTTSHIKLSSWTVHVPVTEQVVLQVYRFPGYVQGYGYGYDHEGTPVTTAGVDFVKHGW